MNFTFLIKKHNHIIKEKDSQVQYNNLFTVSITKQNSRI